MSPPNGLSHILITGITPYFLEKGNSWFTEHFKEIVHSRKTQAFFEDNTALLEKDQHYSISEFLRKLDELGYEKVLEVRDLGEFSHLGGAIEVFPINESNAVRVEFIGNRIDTIEKLSTAIDNEAHAKEILQKRLKSQKLFSDLKGLKESDYLVHLDHGVARFVGISQIGKDSYYILEYAAEDKLFVPLGLERKLSRYVGFTDPVVSRLGSLTWQKTKRKAKEEVERLAKELLSLYAKRQVATHAPYEYHESIEEELAKTFPYEETPDQKQALKDIFEDLASTNPMDRVLCGDVGFGKTEVALRTMVHAAHNGYQAALLAPTTILAHQHYQNFKSRTKNIPLRIAMLSRLQTKKEQDRIVEEIKAGNVDLIIGTHRILSNDISFKNLGLLVIDDEQRFGVKQKEKLKEIRAELNVLSLSATPIPRTLYMALSSLKEISTIQTPPVGRLAVELQVARRSNQIIQDAIEKELARNGQVYYLHNRVGTIEAVKKHLQKLVPAAKFGIVHGQMTEKTLISTMEEFERKDTNVLIATTIIENGLDVPSVGTIIVEDAAKLGLAQAYQVKGRVGRSNIQSFAYFLHGGDLSQKARLRLEALKEARELASGWRVALRDMEIRGAGNILGKEQAGTINTIGLNLYCQMLNEAVEKTQHRETEQTVIQ